jgi:hypothetical protein
MARIVFSPTLYAQYISLLAEAEDGAMLDRVELGLREGGEALPQECIIYLGDSFASIELSRWGRYYHVFLLNDEIADLLGELGIFGGSQCRNGENLLLSPERKSAPIELSPLYCKGNLSAVIVAVLEQRLSTPSVVAVLVDGVDDVVERTKPDRLDGLVGREHLHEFVVIDSIVEIDFAALLAAYLGEHDAAAAIEADVLAEGDQYLLHRSNLVVQDLINLYAALEGHRNHVAARMHSCSLDYFSFFSLDAAVSSQSAASHQSLLRGLHLALSLDSHVEIAGVGEGTVDPDGLLGGCEHEGVGTVVCFNLLVLVLYCLQLHSRPATQPLGVLEVAGIIDSLVLLRVKGEEVFLGREQYAGGGLLTQQILRPHLVGVPILFEEGEVLTAKEQKA